MTKYTIVTDEVQRILNDVSDQLMTIKADYSKVDEDVEQLRTLVCGASERSDQSPSGSALDSALTRYYHDEVDPFVEDLRLNLGNIYLAMQDVLNYYTSGDAEQAWRANSSGDDVPFELTQSGEGDPPSTFDTRSMHEDSDVRRDGTPTTMFQDSRWNHANA